MPAFRTEVTRQDDEMAADADPRQRQTALDGAEAIAAIPADDVAAYRRMLDLVRSKTKIALALYLASLLWLVPRAHHVAHHRFTAPVIALLMLSALYCAFIAAVHRYLSLKLFMREQVRRQAKAGGDTASTLGAQALVDIVTRLWPVALYFYAAIAVLYALELVKI